MPGRSHVSEVEQANKQLTNIQASISQRVTSESLQMLLEPVQVSRHRQQPHQCKLVKQIYASDVSILSLASTWAQPTFESVTHCTLFTFAVEQHKLRFASFAHIISISVLDRV